MESEEKDINKVFIPSKYSYLGRPKEKKKDFLDVLKMFAPGTSIRAALDDLLRAGMGALIVFENEYLKEKMEIGFKINESLTPQRLVELSKMDGAVVVSSDAKKILYANCLLSPSRSIETRETGTRHKAAERIAKEIGTIAIAVSERKRKISLYYELSAYELGPSSEILRKVSENLQILERQVELFKKEISDLDYFEIKDLVGPDNVSIVLRRLEIIRRVSSVIKRYLIELGKEGVIFNMRVKELIDGLSKEEEFILRDYFENKIEFPREALSKLDFDFLLSTKEISRILFGEEHSRAIFPKGIRILNKTNLPLNYIDSLVGHFKRLDKILSADDEELINVLDGKGMLSFFKREIYNLKDKISTRA